MVGEASVLLDAMDGYQFEDFCADLLTRLGYGRVEKTLYSQDGGRDILIQSPSGLVVVECKHQPNTSIGRPIVQKLHSAVLTSKAVRGLLVTTGRFTKEANEYAKLLASNGTIIEMIDRPILGDMASRAGVRLLSKGENLGVWTYALPAADVTTRSLATFLSSNVQSSPRSPADHLMRQNRAVSYRPVYLVTYNVHSVFETTVGIVHKENVDGANLIFDGNNGTQYKDDVFEFLKTEQQTRFNGSNVETSGALPTFRLDFTTLQDKAKDAIIHLHTRHVRYSGRNNVSYTKECVPGDRDVYISDIRQLYLPLTRLDFALGVTPYVVQGVLAPSGRLMASSHDVLKCRVCNLSIAKDAVLCDACGKVTHSGGFRLKNVHGFKCGRCTRTTCRTDGYWSRRFLVWRTLMCQQCAQKNAPGKVKRLTPT